MVVRTVDLVVAGERDAALAAAAEALRRGRRVLVVLASGDPRARRRVRRQLQRSAHAADSRLTVMANAEVVCVDGVDCVEAVVIRYVRTRRLHAVNAGEFLS